MTAPATTSNPAPQGTTLGAAPENGTVPTKPKRKARASKAKQPVSHTTRTVTLQAKQRKPRRTLLAQIEAMGPSHVRAYRALSEGDRTWAAALNHALGAEARVREAFAAKEAAAIALSQATTRHETAIRNLSEGAKFLKQLDDLACSIAHARGEVPHPDDAAPLPTSALRHEQGSADETAVG